MNSTYLLYLLEEWSRTATAITTTNCCDASQTHSVRDSSFCMRSCGLQAFVPFACVYWNWWNPRHDICPWTAILIILYFYRFAPNRLFWIRLMQKWFIKKKLFFFWRCGSNTCSSHLTRFVFFVSLTISDNECLRLTNFEWRAIEMWKICSTKWIKIEKCYFYFVNALGICSGDSTILFGASSLNAMTRETTESTFQEIWPLN